MRERRDVRKLLDSAPSVVDLRASMVDRPGAVLRVIFARLFAAIQFGEAEAERIRAAARRGPLVYALRTVSYLEFLYFNYALRRHGLPLARFANGGVRTILLWPLSIAFRILMGIWRLARGAKLESEHEAMARKLAEGDAVLLFLRPSRRLVGDAREAARVRGRFTEELIALQRRLGPSRAIQLVPMTLIWGHPAVRPGGRGALDALFGEPEAPGRFRAFLQFLRYHRSSQVKVAEPIDLGAFLREHEGRSDEALARTLRFEISGRIERERRAVLGPRGKSGARVRHELLRSRRLFRAVSEIAAKKGTTAQALAPQVDRLLREIAADPRRWAFAFMRRLLVFLFGRMYDGIDVDAAGLDRVREALKRGPLVLLPSHKSHVDYLVLSYVFYENGMPPPFIAAGANLSFFPLGSLFRRLGAFFLRRTFRGDALYAAVFTAYVRKLLRDGNNIEFFIEGGRSRTGKLLRPKLGLLGMVADAVLDGDAPGAQAVPIAITYEKVVEEGSYAKELAGGEKRKEDLGALLKARRVLRSRYGRIDLEIAEPFLLAEALAEAGAPRGAGEAERKQAVRRLGHRVAWEIARATAITPSALVAAACLATPARALPRAEMERRIGWLAVRAREGGARFAAALVADFDGAIRRAIDLLAGGGDLELRGLGADELVVVPDERRPRLEYYKNNAIHALGDLSIVARAVLAAGEDSTTARVRELALTASRLLKNELIYRPSAGFDEVFSAKREELERVGWTRRDGDRIVPTEEGRTALLVVAGLTSSYLDSYRIVLSGLAKHPGLSGRELLSRLVAHGERALLLGELARREAISRPIFESALDFLRAADALGDEAKRRALEADLERVRTPVG